jgi:hypothetical protein
MPVVIGSAANRAIGAALAKASLCGSNPYRSTAVRAGTIARACHMYNNLTPEELDREELKSVFGILVRLAYEQFPYRSPSTRRWPGPKRFSTATQDARRSKY